MKKLFAILLLSTFLLTACGGAEEEPGAAGTPSSDNVVYVYNYGDYIDPDVLDLFEEETGIEVVYDVYDTNEEMYPVISTGSVSYDVVCPSEYMVEKMIQNDMLVPINYDNVPNFQYISDAMRGIAEEYDPGNVYSVPYNWGTVGILYNTEMIPEGELTCWADLWDEKYYDEIMMQDSLRDIYMVPLKILGYSANTTDEQELREATDLLIAQKPLVYKYATDAIRDFVLNESVAIGVIYSGEVLYCQEENEALDYVLPEEGSNVWVDSWVIPATARHKENAEAWINFMCRPDIGLLTFDYIYYSTPNQGTLDLMAEDEEYAEYLDNPAFNPPEELLEKCEIYHYLGPEADELYNNFWKEFKTS